MKLAFRLATFCSAFALAGCVAPQQQGYQQNSNGGWNNPRPQSYTGANSSAGSSASSNVHTNQNQNATQNTYIVLPSGQTAPTQTGVRPSDGTVTSSPTVPSSRPTGQGTASVQPTPQPTPTPTPTPTSTYVDASKCAHFQAGMPSEMSVLNGCTYPITLTVVSRDGAKTMVLRGGAKAKWTGAAMQSYSACKVQRGETSCQK